MTAKTRRILLVSVVVLAGVFVAARASRQSADEGVAAKVRKGPIEVWTVCDGYLESRNVRQIMSQLAGAATVVELASDGVTVKEGDVLVRFDAAQWERDILRLERDYAIAREDLKSLENARLPMEIRALELRLAEVKERHADERQILEDNAELVSEDLISEQETRQQEMRVKNALTQVESVEQELELTGKYIHPSVLERSRATMLSAAQELDLARRQVSNCVVTAPSAGVVGYKPVVVGSEFRPVRVGDTVFRNQPFMTVSDMGSLVMYCDVPEAELSRLRTGSAVYVKPVACPDLSLKGIVESIGATARTASGRAGGQKYFSVVINLLKTDGRLRSGMTAQARVLAYSKPDAVLIPRMAVWWEGGDAYCNVSRLMGVARTRIVTGMANETDYEVLDGLDAGSTVVLK